MEFTPGEGYLGSLEQNVIRAYTPFDVLSFFGALPSLFVLFLAPYTRMKVLRGAPSLGQANEGKSVAARCPAKPRPTSTASNDWPLTALSRRISARAVILCALVMFACWLPYLFVYWPGLVFPDTLNSLDQLMGYRPWNNHHPVPYTLFIGACIQIAHLVGGDSTLGCALYCLVQMGLMATCLAYLSCWTITRGGLNKVWLAIVVVLFAASPYYATFSIALWKDPAFSASIVMLTVLLGDLVLAKGRVTRLGKWWLFAFIAFALLATFTRNNGTYILAATGLCLVAWLWFDRKQRRTQQGVIRAALCILVVVALSMAANPVYALFGIEKTEPSESLGMPLAQMARVAAVGGEMSVADAAYMDTILPLERYPEAYRPGSIDTLKWDAQFNMEALEHDFFARWASMFEKNPSIYLEAWVFQTVGYWAVNQPEVLRQKNIDQGDPLNTEEGMDRLAHLSINTSAGIDDGSIRFDLLPLEGPSVPSGLLFWLVAYLATSVVLLGKPTWLIPLIPSIALFGTLLVASPIWYWQRYIAAAQMLLPFYLLLLWTLLRPHQPCNFKNCPKKSRGGNSAHDSGVSS